MGKTPVQLWHGPLFLMKRIDPYRISGEHPVTKEPVDLKWYRGARRYNNGATRFGKKYLLRYLFNKSK